VVLVKIHIDKIGDDGLDLDEPLTREWLAEALGPDSVFAPAAEQGEGQFVAHLTRLDDVVHVRGRVHVQLEAVCSRCLAPVILPMDTPLQVTAFPKGREPTALGDKGDGELTDDDMGVTTYENQEIDLARVVQDEVFLELPMTPLCSEDCAGLCRTCGHNLNEGPCNCAPSPDMRWSALGRIKLKSN
jgi:uncharacterized protein